MSETMAFNGLLERADFAARVATFALAPGRRPLACRYADAVEPELLRHPRGWLRVSGRGARGEDGLPLSMESIDAAEAVDLRPIVVDGFDCDGQRVALAAPRAFVPELDESGQLLVVAGAANAPVDVYAETHAELEAAVRDCLAFLWRTYALAPDAGLTADAQELKRQILAMARA